MAPADQLAGGQVGVADRGADPQPALGRLLDPVMGQAGDVDEVRRALDAKPHQVDQVGPAAEVGRARCRGRRHGAAGVLGPFVGERPHGAARAIAATIPG